MLSNKVNSLNGRVAELNNTKTYLTDMLDAQQTSLSSIRANLDFVSDPKVKTVALRGMNTLVSKIATVHWNTETHEVIFNAKGLPQNTVSKQYQLWAIVNGKPVDAGVIILTNGVAFQKMKPIEGAQAFAVTIEKAGGSDTPTLDTMCLLGNV